MLIGSSFNKSSLQTVLNIKHALHDALKLPDDAMISLSELVCLEEDCPPIETVLGLLRSDAPHIHCKIHKRADAIDADDLVQVCQSWGFDVQRQEFTPFIKER